MWVIGHIQTSVSLHFVSPVPTISNSRLVDLFKIYCFSGEHRFLPVSELLVEARVWDRIVGVRLWKSRCCVLSCLPGWTRDCLQEWGSFIQLAIPSMFMVCIEWWTFEVGTFLAGWSALQ